MADPETNKCDRQMLGNILVLGSRESGKIILVQELTCNSMFGKLEGVHWISKVQLSKQREDETDYCFNFKVEFLRRIQS